MSQSENKDNYSAKLDAIDSNTDNNINNNSEYPVLALRDMVVFPENTASLFIGRSVSLKAANAAHKFGTPIVLLTQKRAEA